jgi:mannitol-1-phosphate 5-dehydrogenase
MKAVVIGPGRIGCGFVGELLRASGHEVTFVGRNRGFVEQLNRTQSYHVCLSSRSERRQIIVRGISAICSEDGAKVASAIAAADLVCTSVGPQNLPAIAPLIASGLARRNTPVNVLAFENLINAGPCLRKLVSKSLAPSSPDIRHGFSGALVYRVVTRRSDASDPSVFFVGDHPEEFVVDARALVGAIPRLRGMVPSQNFAASVSQKLYTFSAGHATTAYLGSLKGYHYIHTAIRDREIRSAVLAAMREGQRGLAARFGREWGGGERELLEIVARFENAALNDPITRVGRDPQRKLGRGERLIGAARLAEKAGIFPAKLALASAAALCFCNPADPSCDELQRSLDNSGVEVTLNRVCGLDSRRGLGRTIVQSWDELLTGWQRGNLLLSLDDGLWAWS